MDRNSIPQGELVLSTAGSLGTKALLGTLASGVGLVSIGAVASGASTPAEHQTPEATPRVAAMASAPTTMESCVAEFGLGKSSQELAHVVLSSSDPTASLDSNVSVIANVSSTAGDFSCLATPAWTSATDWETAMGWTIGGQPLIQGSVLQPGILEYPGTGYFKVPSTSHTYLINGQLVKPTSVTLSASTTINDVSISVTPGSVAALNLFALEALSPTYLSQVQALLAAFQANLVAALPQGDPTVTEELAFLNLFYSGDPSNFANACVGYQTTNPTYISDLLASLSAYFLPSAVTSLGGGSDSCSNLMFGIIMGALTEIDRRSLPTDVYTVTLAASPTTTSLPTTTTTPGPQLASTGQPLALLAGVGLGSAGLGAALLRRRRRLS